MIFHIGVNKFRAKIVMVIKVKVIIAIVHLKAIVVPASMTPFINKEN